jgi:hypothetical protein
MANSTARIFQIPDEVTEAALTLLHPVDVAKFSQTCRSAHALVYLTPDQYLWRELLLHSFDDPRHAFIPQRTHNSAPYNWKVELQQRVQAKLVAFSKNQTPDSDEHQFALNTIISVIWGAAPVQNCSEHQPSDSLMWVSRICDGSSILDVAHDERNDQTISRIRTYLLRSLDEAKYEIAMGRFNALRTNSQLRAYNISC